MVQSKRRW